MLLYLLRHGLEANKNTLELDPEWNRALSPQGVRRMERAAAAMRVLGITFSEIYTSPSARARETAETIAEAYHWQHRVTVTDALAVDKGFTGQLEPHSPIMTVLRQRHLDSTLLVGHEPDLSQLASLLLVGSLRLKLELKKGGLCVIDMHDPLDSSTNSLISLLDPGQLRSIRGGVRRGNTTQAQQNDP